MGKRGRNPQAGPGRFKVGGHAVEDGDASRRAKLALGREAARRQRRAGRKTRLGDAPKEQRAKEPPPAGAKPLASVEEHGRQYARMNERKPPKRVKAARDRDDDGAAEQPRYLGDRARRVIRTAARYVYTPVALARAVVDHFRERE